MQLARSYDQILSLRAQLWAISPQSVESNQALIRRRDLPFPVLSDVDQAVIRKWGIFDDEDSKGRSIPYPATYVLNASGSITWSYIGTTNRDRPTPEDILAQIRRLVD